MIFDPTYFLYVLPALALSLWAQVKVKSTFAKASRTTTSTRWSGAEVAQRILASFGLDRDVRIEETKTKLGDHYDPRNKVLRLSPDVYHGNSAAAFGVAAHEVGHAIQHAKKYPLLVVRNMIVPLAGFGSNASIFLIIIGMLIQSAGLLVFGIILFSTVVLFQIVNLPVEFDASARAKKLLVEQGYLQPAEMPMVNKMLNAAALTYVAATLTSIMTLIYYISVLRR